MQLKSERLNLVEISLSDLENIHQLHSLPETDKYNTLGIPASIHTTEKILNEWYALQKATARQSYIFCIKLPNKDQFIGVIALTLGKANYKNAEIWYKLSSKFWGQGFATEALTKILQFGFNHLGLHRIEAGCAVENIASLKVLEKVGMIREGRKRKILPIKGNWMDNYFYAILETDFHTLPNHKT